MREIAILLNDRAFRFVLPATLRQDRVAEGAVARNLGRCCRYRALAQWSKMRKPIRHLPCRKADSSMRFFRVDSGLEKNRDNRKLIGDISYIGRNPYRN